jgi:hypothetical protein
MNNLVYDDWSWRYIDNGYVEPYVNVITYPACGSYRTPREKVQDEILEKTAIAVRDNNLREAKRLLSLAQKLKEL